MSTKKTQKAKAKKPTIPPPPAGWQIISKNDPRLDCLPCGPMFLSNGKTWMNTGFKIGEKIPLHNRPVFLYALPIATQPAAKPAQPMIRLRLPSEKPTKEDGNKDGNIITFRSSENVFVRPWHYSFDGDVIAWLPGRLPDGILPREPSQEELWRKEFERLFPGITGITKSNMWNAFLAAKKSTK